MPWLAALAMALLYLYNVPIVVAFVWNKSGRGLAVRPFSPRAACRAAEKYARSQKKRKRKKRSKIALSLRAVDAMKQLLPAVTLEYIRMQARLGLDDAAATALACGALNSLCHILGCRARERDALMISPEFNRTCIEVDACAVISVRVCDALRAAAKTAQNKRAHAPIQRFLRIYGAAAGNNSSAGG
jgi:hypothetical protein